MVTTLTYLFVLSALATIALIQITKFLSSFHRLLDRQATQSCSVLHALTVGARQVLELAVLHFPILGDEHETNNYQKYVSTTSQCVGTKPVLTEG